MLFDGEKVVMILHVIVIDTKIEIVGDCGVSKGCRL